MKTKVLITVMLFSAFTAAHAQVFSVKKGGHAYTLEIPDYLTKTYALNSVATLQYMNTEKEAYVIVIEDPKDLLAEQKMTFAGPGEFLDSFLTDFHKDDKDRAVGAAIQFISNTNKHSQAEMTWESADQLKFYMIITVVETPAYFYKILTWTLAENKDTLKKDFLRIARSLKD